MRNLINYILKSLNNIIPKDNKKIVFISRPDYSDNSKVFYEYIKNKDKYNFVWIVEKEEVVNTLQSKGIVACENYSVKAILSLLTARYIVSTHNNFLGIKSKKQKYIALWHGMPLKTIYFLENDYDKNLKHIDFAIATSNIMRLAMASAFNLDPRKVIVTGQPRNDSLFKQDIDINKILDINNDKFEKIIFYLPTYRNGAGRKEGLINNSNIINIDKYDEKRLNLYLKEKNYLLIAKFHPAEESEFKNLKYSNIKILESKTLTAKNINLNEILNKVDLLITDYSSVYFDYLILNRPMLFINMDENEYNRDRGFVFDNPSFWRPGPKVSNFENFILELDELINNEDYYKKDRDCINSLINLYRDNKSSERVFEEIFK